MIAPTVPIAESRPTIEPLVWRSVSVARTIIGPTADRIAAGRTNPTAASVTIATKPSPRSAAPSQPTIGTEAMAAAPPSTNDGPSKRSGPNASAARPPIHAPSAMPARIAPMIPVYVVSDTPTYGARSRPAAISRTSTQAVARKVRIAATGQVRRRPRSIRGRAGSDKRCDFLPANRSASVDTSLGVGCVEPQGPGGQTPSVLEGDRTSAAISSAVPRIA